MSESSRNIPRVVLFKNEVTRTIKTWELRANLQGEEHVVVLEATCCDSVIARRAFREATGKRLPYGTEVSRKLVKIETFSMPLEEFKRHARISSTTERG